MTQSARNRRLITFALVPLLALATSGVLVAFSFADDGAFEKPSVSCICDVELSSSGHRIVVDSEAVITFRYAARRGPPEQGEEDVMPNSEIKSLTQRLFNPLFVGGTFPSCGEIVVFDRDRKTIGILHHGPTKGRPAAKSDWVELRIDNSIGCEIPLMLAVPGKDGEIGNSPLPVGRYYLQAKLRRRFWGDGPFAIAEEKVSNLPSSVPLVAEDGRLTPERAKSFADRMSGAAYRKSPEYPKFFDEELRKWLHPSGDEVVFRSNIVEIEVVAPENGVSDK